MSAHRTLHSFDEASPSPSGTRATHSRQMSSLSMTTFTTSQSHYPSEPLLRNADHQEAYAQPPRPPDTFSEERRDWEQASARRMRRLRLLKGALMSIIGSWALYTTVRYFIAYAVYSDSTRRSVALSLGISSLLSLLVAGALALSLAVPHHHSWPISRSLGKSLRHLLRLLASFFVFAPAAVNLALVFSWRNTGSEFSLRGRCHWGPDVVWVGVGGQCTRHAPVWGVWLAAVISRFVLTVAILILYHLVSKTYRASQWLHYCAQDAQRRDTVDITRDTPSRPSAVLHPFIQTSAELPTVPQRSFSSGRMAVIPEVRNQVPVRYEHEYAGLDSVDSSTLSEDDSLPRSVESSSPPSKPLRHTKSSRDLPTTGDSSSRRAAAALVSNVTEGELEGFADRFRAIVDRVSRELEDARHLENENEPAPRTPPMHHVLDTHTPYMSIDEFGREVHTEEPIPMFGGVVRRMPTIDSVGSREHTSLRSGTLVAPSSSTSSRPPTRATMVSFNDAASASVSATSSRSNSIHRPQRMPSELGEIVRDALRVRGGPHRTAARPGSGGSSSVESASRSRSNSQAANEVLAPVTEYGEHGFEPEIPLRAPQRRLCDTPELLGAAPAASELGELVSQHPSVQRSRSLGSSSSPSRSGTSTTYFTAGTGSSGDTGASSAPR